MSELASEHPVGDDGERPALDRRKAIGVMGVGAAAVWVAPAMSRTAFAQATPSGNPTGPSIPTGPSVVNWNASVVTDALAGTGPASVGSPGLAGSGTTSIVLSNGSAGGITRIHVVVPFAISAYSFTISGLAGGEALHSNRGVGTPANSGSGSSFTYTFTLSPSTTSFQIRFDAAAPLPSSVTLSNLTVTPA